MHVAAAPRVVHGLSFSRPQSNSLKEDCSDVLHAQQRARYRRLRAGAGITKQTSAQWVLLSCQFSRSIFSFGRCSFSGLPTHGLSVCLFDPQSFSSRGSSFGFSLLMKAPDSLAALQPPQTAGTP